MYDFVVWYKGCAIRQRNINIGSNADKNIVVKNLSYEVEDNLNKDKDLKPEEEDEDDKNEENIRLENNWKTWKFALKHPRGRRRSSSTKTHDRSQLTPTHNIKITINSSWDEIANVYFLYDDIVHTVQNTIDSCINFSTDRRGYVLERRFTKFSEITQCNGHYAVQRHSRLPISVSIENLCTTSY